MSGTVDRSVRRTLENVEVWKDWDSVLDRGGRLQRQMTLEDRFWTHVTKGGPDECWEWRGTVTPRAGHGVMAAGDIKTTAHRVAWAITYGSIAPGKVICHRCDNPPCCNPAHLFIGTQLDNMRDCSEKVRNHHGIRTGGAVLNDDLVRTIRVEYATGTVSQTELGRRYKVDQNTIWKVVRNVTWRHVA